MALHLPVIRRAAFPSVLAAHVLPGLVAAFVALALLEPLSTTRATLGPGTVDVAASAWAPSGTVLEVPPLGRVSAPTHHTVVGVEVRLVELDIEAVQERLGSFDGAKATQAEIEAGIPGLLRRAALGTMARAAVLGAAVGLLLPARRWWHLLVGAGGATLAVAIALGGVARSFDVTAYSEASYEGALERAPAVFDAVRSHVEGLDEVEDRVETLSAQLEELFAAASGDLVVARASGTTILHVSDIHSNPIGVEIAAQLARSFGVDAVLDTGDLTSFGLPVEARIGELIAGIGTPWYLVAGNHDSPQVRDALADSPNITVLDRTVVDIAGVRVLGIADPTFTADNEVSTEDARALKEDAAGRVAAIVRGLRPDLLAVHDLTLAGEVGGDVPVVVAGHVHRTTSEERDGTLFLTVGSTGATGLGSFTVEADLPYEAQLLRFDVDGVLVAIDRISVDGLTGGFTIDREVLEPPVSDP